MPSEPRIDQAVEAAPAELTAALHILIHDLCSPLQSLIASNETLSMQAALDEDGRRAVARIRRATQSLSAQLNDLTALARIQAGDTKSQDISFEAGALLQEVAALGHHNLSVALPIAPVFARGDPSLILQVLDRLVRTAVALHGQGTLCVEEVGLHGRHLSFRLQFPGHRALPNKIVQRLKLVRVIAAALKGDLETVLNDPRGLLFILRVGVEFEDPNALATV
jgi:signal transduction histidine kinase